MLLDLLRGVAALLVLLEHWRNLLFIDYPQLPLSLRHWLLLPYLLCSAGHQAVIIFFVMSGYLISASVFRMIDRSTWTWPLYLTHRLLRLWVVLIPGLLLCTLWDNIGVHSSLTAAVYGGYSNNHITHDIRATLNLPTFLGNLVFLQGIVTNSYGSDGALWSLAYEFWYYILFPLGLFALRRQTKTSFRLLFLVLFALVAWFVYPWILLYFPIWLTGTALALMPLPACGLRPASRPALCMSFSSLPAQRTGFSPALRTTIC